MQKVKKAIYPGSFNPFHSGHKEVLKKALKIFDEIYILVAQNPDKEKNDIEQNIKNIKLQINELQNVFIIENHKNKLTANIAKEMNINFLIRSARNNADYSYEFQLASINKSINNKLETILIIPDNQFLKYSSTEIRKIKEKNV
ncbi:phosphopantetheine adenylyltransferase [Mycoplasmopsis canis UFG4]|uniref:Pantetheine-phosphate adenylyltransferase n=1 Tax=Mycoplasmopsis canis UFG4 TaxID=1131455 RepID=I1A6M5_9BACT|nr:pantetheine-phosphate adenylyltransferase [Mycoplasmopsis canis]EIE42146.1 phosphopantetheine adenylyltransferase [Mycoplasmopsis canis UFG4]